MASAKSTFGWLFGAFALFFMAFAGDAFAQSRPYDISGLDPTLRSFVESARVAEMRSVQAAARAQFDVAGTVRFKGNANDSYEGEGYGSGADANRHGYGLLTWADGEYYAGQFRGGSQNAGVKEGLGVYVFADGRRYEGQWLNEQRHGYGVQWDPGGNLAFAGYWNNGEPPQ
jgi:hypothetical protein